MLWVYGHYEYFDFFSAGIDFIRQNLTYEDGPRAERVNAVVAVLISLNITSMPPPGYTPHPPPLLLVRCK